MTIVNIQRLFNENFECFYEGKRRMGMTTIDLPTLTGKTVTIAGAGIAGEMDYPASGQLQNMEFTIHWRTLHKVPVEMNENRAHLLQFRGAINNYDAGQGKFSKEAVVVDVRGVPAELAFGKFEQAAETETETKMHLDYLKLTVGGETVLEFDRFNYIYKVNGTDWLADTRTALAI